MRQRILYLSHYLSLASQSGRRRVYAPMRRDCYWPNMERNMYQTMTDCHRCERNGTILEQKTSPSTTFCIRAPGFRDDRNFGTIGFDYKRKLIRCCHYRQVRRTNTSNPYRTHHDHKHGVHIPAWPDYPAQNSNLYFNRQCHTVINQAPLHTPSAPPYKETYCKRWPPFKRMGRYYVTTRQAWRDLVTMRLATNAVETSFFNGSPMRTIHK